MCNKKSQLSLVLCLVFMVVTVLSACSVENRNESKKIIASFYPLQYILDELIGTPGEVENVTPIGAEPHDLELSPDAVEDIHDAEFVLVMGDGFQPAVERIAKENNNSFAVLDELFDGESVDDPHFWLDPVLMQQATTIISKKLIERYPDKKTTIELNANELNAKLDTLNSQFVSAFQTCETKTIITSHEAFGYMAKRYGLEQESIAGFSPENEPTPDRLSKLVELANKTNTKVIFSEDLVSDKLAKALASEIGANTETLNAVEFLTDEDLASSNDYFSIMLAAKVKIASALGCG